MFFKIYDSSKGYIKSIFFDIHNLELSVCDHLKEVLKNKVKIEDNKVIIKTPGLTIEELKTINEGYEQFHSQFILDNVINNKK